MADQSNIILQIVAKLRDELSAPLAKVKKEIEGVKPKPLVEVDEAAKKAAGSARGLSSAFEGIGKQAASFALGIGINDVVRGISSAVVDLVAQARELEKALDLVQISSDDASVQNDDLAASVRNLAIEYGKSATSIGRSAGIIAEQTTQRTLAAIQGLNEVIQDFASIGLGSSPEDAAQRAVNFAKAFQIDTSDLVAVRQALAVAAQAAREANEPFARFVDSLTFIGPLARNSKASLEEMAAIIADVSSRGIEAGRATVTLTRFLELLRDRTSPAREAIEVYTGALEDNLTTLELIERVQKGLFSSELQADVLGGAFGRGNTAAAIALVNTNVEKLRASLEDTGGAGEFAGNRIERAFNQTGAEIDRLEEKLSLSNSGIGDFFENVYRGLLRSLTAQPNELRTQGTFLGISAEKIHSITLEADQLARSIKLLSGSLDDGDVSALGYVKALDSITEAARDAAGELRRIPDSNIEFGTTGAFAEELERQRKEFLEFNKQAVAAERSLLEPTKARIAQVRDEIAVTEELIRVRSEQSGGAADNTALEIKLAAQRQQLEQAVIKDLLAHSVALDKVTKGGQAFARMALTVAAETAKMAGGFRAATLHAEQLYDVLQDKLGGIRQNKEAIFEFALRPQIQIEEEKLTADVRQQLEPMIAEIEESMALDPGNFDKVSESIDKLAAKMRELRAEASDFSKGFDAGLADKVAEFADKTRQGYEFAQGAIESFAERSSQAILELVRGTGNLRDVLRGFLDDIASLASKALAKSFAAELFGLALADGGVVSGGMTTGSGVRSYAPGGIAVGPQLALIGDNHAQREAVVPLPGAGRGIPVEFKNGGGGGSNITVQVNYTVQALDARSVRELLVEHGRTIGDVAADQIAKGRHVGLRQSVRGVR